MDFGYDIKTKTDKQMRTARPDGCSISYTDLLKLFDKYDYEFVSVTTMHWLDQHSRLTENIGNRAQSKKENKKLLQQQQQTNNIVLARQNTLATEQKR